MASFLSHSAPCARLPRLFLVVGFISIALSWFPSPVHAYPRWIPISRIADLGWPEEDRVQRQGRAAEYAPAAGDLGQPTSSGTSPATTRTMEASQPRVAAASEFPPNWLMPVLAALRLMN